MWTWPPFPQWMVELSTIASNLAVVVAAVAAIIGLQQWRHELVGKSRHELAYKIIALSNEFGRRYNNAREFYFVPDEVVGRNRHPNETAAETSIKDDHYARVEHLGKLSATLNKLEDAALDAVLILGLGDSEIVEPFLKAYKELWGASYKYYSAKLNEIHSPDMPHVGQADEIKLRGLVFGQTDDEYDLKVKAIIGKLKDHLRKYIR